MVHEFKNNGYNIVLDVNSGSVHVVDEIVYDLIPVVEEILVGMFGKAQIPDEEENKDLNKELLEEVISKVIAKDTSHAESDIPEAVEEILYLRQAGQLYTDDIYENYVEEFING